MTLTYQRFTAVLLLIYGSLFLSGIYYCLRVFWCAAARMSEVELEQRTNIKFLVKLGKSGNEVREILVQVYGDNAMIKQQFTSVWNVVSDGRESVTDQESSGRPATSTTEENIAKIRQIVRENRQLTVRSIAEQVNINRETVRKILTEDLYMRKVCAKMVPKGAHRRTKEKKSHNLPFGEAIWHFGPCHHRWWNMGLPIRPWNEAAQSAQWKTANSPRSKKFRRPKSRVKTTLLTFLDIRAILHYEFIPTGQTVNQVYYMEVLERLREKVRRKRPELFANNSRILHHVNAPAHTALSVREVLATKQINVLEHPAYSPDLAPQWLFSVPEDEGNIERKAFWWHWWHQE